MPHHDSVDVAYDPVRNVYIMDGGHLGWNTDHLGVREVWTYRFKRGAKLQPALPPTPQGVKCVTTPSGVELTWDAVDGAKGYLVYRAEGEAWRIRPERCFAQPLHATRFSEGGPEPRRVRYYCVTSISGDGRESPRSLIARTQPPLVRDVVVSTLADRTVRIAWSHADAPDVAGYHVYASTVKLGEMHPFRLYGKIRPLTRLTDKPVASPVFLDERPLAGEQGDFVHEVRAYEIRAVNTWGVESGPSATTLNVASSVPRVRAIERPDGATLVQWDASPEDGITGYRVYRMDDYRPSCVFLLNPAPVAGTEFADRPDAPKAERRKYYVVAVNALGQEGLPSSGAYSFGRP
jgi:fibronectin type 3 domain-containing protein